MKSLSPAYLIGAFALIAVAVPLFNPEPSDLMAKKTKHAQEILRFLAKGDMPAASREARALESVTIQAGFEEKSDLYSAYGDEFLNQVRGLAKMADSGNISGTYYYFTRMTGVCFSCHEHVRDAASAKKPE